MKTSLFPALISLLLLTACHTSTLLEQDPATRARAAMVQDSVFGPNRAYAYRIRKDDKISISVWGQDELSVGSVYGIYNSNEVYGKWLMVDAYGTIEVPKIGLLRVEGMTVPQLRDTIAARISDWIVRPVVDIKVLNKEITVLGEVRNPQVVPVDKDHNSLLEIIARSGGFEFYADLKSVKVLRQHGPDVHIATLNLEKETDLDLQNIPLYPGDVIIVPSKKYKAFDKRVSVIIPFTTTVSAAAILLGLF